jgi:phage shock protein C
MSDAGSGSPRGGRRDGGARSGDFQSSVSRLERAVNELVTTARDQFSERATTVIEETTRRLERELDRRQVGTGASTSEEGTLHSYNRGYGRQRPLARKLYRDPGRTKIGGVCAGIARYYGVDAWVVRCIAITGLLFFPTIVFPAYWIAYFVMDKPPKPNGDPDRGRGRHGRHDHRSPAPELGPRLSPRYSLRNVQADLTEVELRLRRMETHVTSGQYELQRELNKIDGGSDGRSA